MRLRTCLQNLNRYSYSRWQAAAAPQPRRLPAESGCGFCWSWTGWTSSASSSASVRRNLWTSVSDMEGDQPENVEQGERDEKPDRYDKQKDRVVEELLKIRTENEITIEATVDTGFEFMAIEECRSKFGQDFHVVKERGSIMFNIAKEKYPEVSCQFVITF